MSANLECIFWSQTQVYYSCFLIIFIMALYCIYHFIVVPSLYATDADSVHKDHISSDKSEHDKIIVYTVASVAALLLVIVSLMAACLCKK